MRLDFIPGNFFTQEQILSNINVAISTMCFARMASYICLCSPNFFFLFLMQFLKVTFHLQLLQNIGCICHFGQYILKPVLHPMAGASRSPIPISPSNSPLLWKPPVCCRDVVAVLHWANNDYLQEIQDYEYEVTPNGILIEHLQECSPFAIVYNPAPAPAAPPSSGDSSPLVLWFALAGISLAGALLTFRRRRSA